MNKKISKLLVTLLLLSCVLHGQSIADKKRSLLGGGLSDFDEKTEKLLDLTNRELAELKARLSELNAEAYALFQKDAPQQEIAPVLDRMKKVRGELARVEAQWRQHVRDHSKQDSYALWNQASISLEQLVLDYGSQEVVYIIPPNIASLTVSVASSLPVPRESWGELLHFVLNQNGVGVRQLNDQLRELYLLKKDFSRMEAMTAQEEDLDVFPSEMRVLFLLQPEVTDVRDIYTTLARFLRSESTTLQLMGSDLYIVGPVGEVKELLKVYDFVRDHRSEQDYRLIALKKGDPAEMATILQAIFSDIGRSETAEEEGETPGEGQGGLLVVPLQEIGPALFLLGSQNQVQRAEDILQDLENQIGEAQEKTIYWYTCKHSDPEDLAAVLERVYKLMLTNRIEGTEQPPTQDLSQITLVDTDDKMTGTVPESTYDSGISIVVNPAGIDPSKVSAKKGEVKGENFIIDPKTSSIIMVVEPFALDRLKELLRKLDVPKKMVRIEVLLFEKRIDERSDFGLNFLKIADSATNTSQKGITWNIDSTTGNVASNGIFSFIFSRPASSAFEAFDLAYNFLLSQDNIQINASPSVTTINQTPATIKLVEEISIDTGIVELDPQHTSVLKQSYVRAQYGITIVVTPIVHEWDPFSGEGNPFESYITLETDVTFDTQQAGSNPERPDVTRRNIANQVRVADGEPVILGGLRRKTMEDSRKSIPFFGEIPGVGKFFSSTTMRDGATEMFVFLTPTIIHDPTEDMRKMRCQELKKRPGDLPTFLNRLAYARDCERRELFKLGLNATFGREMPEVPGRHCEYDGRW